MTPLEPILSKFPNNIHKRSPRAEAPLCEAQSFCKSRSAGERSIHNGRDFAKAFIWGQDFAKSQLILFEMFGFGFRPQKGVWGMNAGGNFLDFGGRALRIQNTDIEILAKLKYES